MARAFQRLAGLPPDDLYGFEGDEADVRHMIQTFNARTQRIFEIDDFDHHGSIAFEHMPAVNA